MLRTRAINPLVALSALGLLLAGCASSPEADAPTTPNTLPPEPQVESTLEGEITIFAAASLKASFDELAQKFMAENPGVTVQPISYDGSSTLATQIIEGAPVDVFASANESNMTKVVDANLASSPQLFATNTLTIVVPTGNPGQITGIADLANPDKVVVLCAEEVPCGNASVQLLESQDLSVTASSYEQNVTAVLTKVAAGEADAGLVYVTDASGNNDVEAIATTGADVVINRYPIVALDGAPNKELAQAFVDFVLSADGVQVLSKFGFGAP